MKKVFFASILNFALIMAAYADPTPNEPGIAEDWNEFVFNYCEDNVDEPIGALSRALYTDEFNTCVQAVYSDPHAWNDFTRDRLEQQRLRYERRFRGGLRP